MRPRLTTLLCLVLCLSQRTGTQKETLSRPIIWARPSFMVPEGKQVAIWCQGTRAADEYQLHFEGSLSASQRPKPPGLGNKVKFLIPAMTSLTAGKYHCFYRSGELWSESSDLLNLVVTGMFDTPTLSVHPGPMVISGELVTFYCRLETGTSTFFLLKEGRSSHVQHRYGNAQAKFSMGPVTTAHRGTYRCFGSYNNHVWSFPSEPVELLITGEVESSAIIVFYPLFETDSWDPDLLTTETGFHKDLALWDHAAQNLLRISLAFLVLMALVCLLAEDRLRRKRTFQKKADRASRWECRRRWRNTTLRKDQET
uniref:Natural cytotoxicity triggering receptor 1 n=1 Tax=Otolemur garnettii TaxID=30611 RepID=H0WIA4_OTOGA